MENNPAAPQAWMIALSIGMPVFLFFSWGPAAKLLKKYEPDLEEGFMTMLFDGLEVYVLAVLIMTLAIIAHFLGAIG